jgi:hypothetical protein
MTTPRDTSLSRRARANGDGTVYQRKDGRWEAAGYALAPGNTRNPSASTAPPARKPWPSSPRRSPPAIAACPPPQPTAPSATT